MSLLAHPGRTHVADLMSASKARPNVACVAGIGAQRSFKLTRFLPFAPIAEIRAAAPVDGWPLPPKSVWCGRICAGGGKAASAPPPQP